jgi:GAF domain-containing protein
VCIGDLPLSDYAVPHDTLTEKVAAYLQTHVSIPGVIIMRNDRVAGVVPRHKMFERLGQRYGIELFLRRPISELEKELLAGVFTLKSQLPINTAVQLALGRSKNNIYDPIIVEHEDGSLYLLDMYVLLLTQSQLSTNLSGIISSLNNIETILASEKAGASTLTLILDSMNLVVPFHHACIVLEKQNDLTSLPITNEAVRFTEEPLRINDIYRSILSMNQPLSLEDIRNIPAWRNTDCPAATRSWMGVPISNQAGTIGVVMLSRFTLSPFTVNEKELALVFTRYINSLLINLSLSVTVVQS